MTRNLNDWIENYIKFTENSEPPTQYHLWSAIMAISSCLQRKCYCNWGLKGYVYPNFYAVLVGPPAGRKGTAMKIAKSMLNRLEIEMASDSLGSIQALYKQIRDASFEYKDFNGKILTHKSLSVWAEEFIVFLSDRDPRFMDNLTDLFDCPSKWSYSSLSRNLEALDNCFLTIFGATTPSILQRKLTIDAAGGGFISRVIFVVGYGAIKKVPLPFLSPEEMELQRFLIEDLEQIKLLSGPFEMTDDFLHKYSDWYVNFSDQDCVDSAKLLSYNGRRPLHISKLAMIVCASQSNDMIIRGHHFERALAILEYTEHNMQDAFYGLGRGEHAELMAELLQYIDEKQQVTPGELYARFYLDSHPEDLQKLIQGAKLAGKINEERTPSNKVIITPNSHLIKRMKPSLKDSYYKQLK